MHNNELSFAIVDLSLGERGDSELLNQEDIESTGRDILWYLRENLPNLPVPVNTILNSNNNPNKY